MTPSLNEVLALVAVVPGAEYQCYTTTDRCVDYDAPQDHVEVVLYHKGCADGFGAAWAVHNIRRAKCDEREVTAVFIPVQYGQTDEVVVALLSQLHGRKVNLDIVDFSLPPHQFEELMAIASSVVYLDHHKGAADVLDEARAIAVHHDVPQYVQFVNEHSGAALAWDWFFEGNKIPDVVAHIEDRDLWQFKLDGTREIIAALYSHPMTMDVWDEVAVDTERLYQDGQAILRAHDKNVALLSADWNVQRGELYGHKAARLACPYFYASDAGNKLLDENPELEVAVIVWQSAEEFRLSFWSRKDGVDVSELAKKLGGGGHAAAAGASLRYDSPSDVVLMQKYIDNFVVAS